jgi:hypothetical protein
LLEEAIKANEFDFDADPDPVEIAGGSAHGLAGPTPIDIKDLR